MIKVRKDFPKICEDRVWKFIGYVGEDKRVCFESNNTRFLSTRNKFPPVKLSFKNAIDKTEYLRNLFISKFDMNKYSIDNLKFNGMCNETEFECFEHGIQITTPNKIVKGVGCIECGKKNMGAYLKPKDILSDFKAVHGDIYDYSKFEYTNNRTPSTIICNKHGEFSQTSAIHKRGGGCPKCGKIKANANTKVKIDDFLKSAHEKHGDKYDYTNLIENWSGTKGYYKIGCNIHGYFVQQAYSHTKGHGCNMCNGYGFNRSSFIESADVKNNGIAKLYIVNLFDGVENFYKIGITLRSVDERFSEIPYNCKTIYEFDLNADFVYDMETILHREFKDFSYKPLKSFGGHTECFKGLDTKLVKKIVECTS